MENWPIEQCNQPVASWHIQQSAIITGRPLLSWTMNKSVLLQVLNMSFNPLDYCGLGLAQVGVLETKLRKTFYFVSTFITHGLIRSWCRGSSRRTGNEALWAGWASNQSLTWVLNICMLLVCMYSLSLPSMYRHIERRSLPRATSASSTTPALLLRTLMWW